MNHSAAASLSAEERHGNKDALELSLHMDPVSSLAVLETDQKLLCHLSRRMDEYVEPVAINIWRAVSDP